MEELNKGRLDYQMAVLDGQKLTDVFHQAGLPSNVKGGRKVHLVMHDINEPSEQFKTDLEDIVWDQLENWGFLQDDEIHDFTVDWVKNKNYKLMIYTL